jgi:hypothetical protein
MRHCPVSPVEVDRNGGGLLGGCFIAHDNLPLFQDNE